jgi:hypothetical protein
LTTYESTLPEPFQLNVTLVGERALAVSADGASTPLVRARVAQSPPPSAMTAAAAPATTMN